MRKIVTILILAAGVLALAGCSNDAQNNSGNSSSFSSSSSVVTPESSSEESSSSVSSFDSKEESSVESSSEESSDSLPAEENTEKFYLSTCPVPAWGVTDEGDTFIVGVEYSTHRMLLKTEFENGAVKNIWAELYIVSEDFDKEAFIEDWDGWFIWNNSFYNAPVDIPEEFADMTVEEIKLSSASLILRKYGSETYEGVPEVVWVDPSTPTDPAIEF